MKRTLAMLGAVLITAMVGGGGSSALAQQPAPQGGEQSHAGRAGEGRQRSPTVYCG